MRIAANLVNHLDSLWQTTRLVQRPS